MSMQTLEREVRIVKDDMQEVKDIIHSLAVRTEALERVVAGLAERTEALERVVAAMAERGKEADRRIEANSNDIRVIIDAFERWWGDIRAEYGPGPSGRSDDWEPSPGK